MATGSAPPLPTSLPALQVVCVCVSGCSHPLDLSSLAECPALSSLHLHKCKGTTLCGLHGNTRIREIVAQVNIQDVWESSTLHPLSPPPPAPPPSPRAMT